ncbi:MAG: folate family ECF transporter S component, partial [Anaerotignum sp.]|nr:folate family ECF transporter S component [Anaerotignum sp.]
IGATLFPSGTFFPGFTLTAFITAFGYGFFLHKKQDMPHILAAVLFSEIVGTLLLNTKWIAILYGTAFLPIFVTRIWQAVGMGVVEVVVIKLLAKYVPHLKKTL